MNNYTFHSIDPWNNLIPKIKNMEPFFGVYHIFQILYDSYKDSYLLSNYKALPKFESGRVFFRAFSSIVYTKYFEASNLPIWRRCNNDVTS